MIFYFTLDSNFQMTSHPKMQKYPCKEFECNEKIARQVSNPSDLKFVTNRSLIYLLHNIQPHILRRAIMTSDANVYI